MTVSRGAPPSVSVAQHPAPLPEEQRQRIAGLFTLIASEGPGNPVPQACTSIAQLIDGDALARHVDELAKAPRHALADPEATRAAGRYTARVFGEAGLDVLEIPATVEGVTHHTYAAVVPGRVPEAPSVVVMAHYDSVEGTRAADDNASGVATVLEIARVLPRGELAADVVVAAVPFEERPGGLAGSRALAAWMKREGRGVRAAISAEMTGFATDEPRVYGDTGNDLLVIGYPGTQDVVGTMLDAAHAVAAGAMRGMAFPQMAPEVGRSDHTAFHDEGWPGIMVTDGAEIRNPHYHQRSDTPDTIVAEFHLRSTQALAAGVIALACGPAAVGGMCQSGPTTT